LTHLPAFELQFLNVTLSGTSKLKSVIENTSTNLNLKRGYLDVDVRDRELIFLMTWKVTADVQSTVAPEEVLRTTSVQRWPVLAVPV